MHLRHPGLTYNTFGLFTKKKDRVQETLVKFQEEEDSRYIYQNELDKACFQYDIASGNFKHLTRRTASDKILRDEAFNIVKKPKYDEYQRGLSSVVHNFFDEKSTLLALSEIVAARDKSASRDQLKMTISQTKSYLNNYTNQLLENSRKEKYTQLL